MPPKLKPLNTAGREKLFGKFSYVLDPQPGNPEHIKVTDNWAKDNLVTIDLPVELAALPGADKAVFHKLVAPRFIILVNAWRDAGVLGDIKTWNGSYAPRLVRGTLVGTLSAHAWGNAVDLNSRWNGLGVQGPAVGKPGSVRRLVPIAKNLGWYWGGDFDRIDMMHFEICQL